MYDITILTEAKFIAPTTIDWIAKNVLEEENLLKVALEKRDLNVHRINWDHPTFDWSSTKMILCRTTWDYSDRVAEFRDWLKKVAKETEIVNGLELLLWNMDKHYLQELIDAGINIAPSLFLEIGEERSLQEVITSKRWKDVILKPVIAAGARNTFRINQSNIAEIETIFKALIKKESFVLQEFQYRILYKGEISFMLFGGAFSHAVLKKAKEGDFRVQQDWGGTVYDYNPTEKEIEFSEKVIRYFDQVPTYARVDVFWDNNNELCLAEIELIEPELWFRNYPKGADLLAEVIEQKIKRI